jgi:hypothetical protein
VGEGNNQILIETENPAPPVDELSPPATGYTTGGNTVTITGSGLAGATVVDFGPGNPAPIDSESGDTTLTVTAPPGSAGTVGVVVTAPGGVSTVNGADEYTYTVHQTVPQQVTCGATCPTNTVDTNLNMTSVSVGGPSGSSGATTSLLVNTDTVSCGASKAHDYDYPTAVSTLSANGFATGAKLTVTETVGNEPSKSKFSPTKAAPGAAVTITGKSLNGVIAVVIGGVGDVGLG